MRVLKFLGSHGSKELSSKMAEFFSIGKGAVNVYIYCTVI